MATFQIHLLDVGRKKYGDAIVLVMGTRTILIDGGHPYDHLPKPEPAAPSIPEQLAKVLQQQAPPFAFDLLVVTHTHDDHIGCLPEMVADGTITAKWALVADDRLGWGDVISDAAQSDSRAATALAGLREERPVFGGRDELEAFLSDVEKLRKRYARMLDKLAADGTKVVRYGRDDAGELLDEMKGWGLLVLGPTPRHLELCRQAIDAIGRDFLTVIETKKATDATATAADLFLAAREHLMAVDSPSDVDFESSPGNAINCQSLVLVAQRNDKSVLLTGDMQLADPLVPDLGDEMAALRQRIRDNGPYHMVKLAHHGAANGLDEGVLDDFGSSFLTISTGPGSAKHPHPSTLALLRNHENEIEWLRTDRNGFISVDYSTSTGNGTIDWARGEINDLSANTDAVAAPPAVVPAAGAQLPAPPLPAGAAAAAGVQIAAAPAAAPAIAVGDGFVEVLTRIPRQATRVVLTIEVQPLEQQGASTRTTSSTTAGPEMRQPAGQVISGDFRLAGGRTLDRLLFATDPEALARNIGAPAVESVVRLIGSSAHVLLQQPFSRMSSSRAAGEIIPEAVRSGAKGIVLLGGYDVVPTGIVDVLAQVYRSQVARKNDPDRFYVWSDDVYSSVDGDALPDIPVSRIPDSGSAELLRTALDAGRTAPGGRAGVRNVHRPFAEEAFAVLPGGDALLVSQPTHRRGFPGETLRSGAVYLMLHGHYNDTSLFYGETDDEETVEAFGLENVGAAAGAVVFTGCCWGALTVASRAWDHDASQPVKSRTPGNSLALAYLARGANAFVGCTGAHYSPRYPPYNYASGPLHTAFFRELVQNGRAPAEALLQAKRAYVSGAPYPNPVDPGGPGAAAMAVERKLLSQFVCLGLGW